MAPRHGLHAILTAALVMTTCALERPARAVPPRFVLQSRIAPRGTHMSFSVALPQRNLDEVERELIEVSDPSHSRYGKWWSLQQVANHTAASPEHHTAARAWLEAGGASCVDTPASLRCGTTVEVVEGLLSTRVAHFLDTHTGRDVFRVHPDEALVIPAHLEGVVLFMTKVYTFPVHTRRGRRKRFSAGGAASRRLGADLAVGLETIQTLYGLGGISSSLTSSIGPVEFLNDSAVLMSDIALWASAMGAPAWSFNQTVGPFSGSDSEATLDSELIGGIAQGSSMWYWTVENPDDWIFEWAEAVKSLSTPASVYSISWGGPDASEGAVYVAAADADLMQLGLAGITVVVSSGDTGAHDPTIDAGCSSPTTNPDYPAASPYVLAVGATQLVSSSPLNSPQSQFCQVYLCAGAATEVMASVATGAIITSGGGFATYTKRPSYQSAAVAAYLSSGAVRPPSRDYFSSNRGYPDVAAVGHNIAIAQGGSFLLIDGTSASAPIWAGIIACVNAARLAAGQPVVGFINPALYAIAASSAFNDINCAGCVNNRGSGGTSPYYCSSSATGFGTAVGWDATTGLGTPNVPALIAALVKSRSVSATQTSTVSGSASSTRTQSPSFSLSASLSTSPSQSLTATRSPSQSVSQAATASQSKSATRSASQTPSRSPTASGTPSQTPSVTRSASPTPSNSRTASTTPSSSLTPSQTESAAGTPTPSNSRTASTTRSASPTPSLTESAAATPSQGPSASASQPGTLSSTPTSTLTLQQSLQPTPIFSPSSTPLASAAAVMVIVGISPTVFVANAEGPFSSGVLALTGYNGSEAAVQISRVSEASLQRQRLLGTSTTAVATQVAFALTALTRSITHSQLAAALAAAKVALAAPVTSSAAGLAAAFLQTVNAGAGLPPGSVTGAALSVDSGPEPTPPASASDSASSSPSSLPLAIIIGCVVGGCGAVLLASLAAALVCGWRRKRSLQQQPLPQRPRAVLGVVPSGAGIAEAGSAMYFVQPAGLLVRAQSQRRQVVAAGPARATGTGKSLSRPTAAEAAAVGIERL